MREATPGYIPTSSLSLHPRYCQLLLKFGHTSALTLSSREPPNLHVGDQLKRWPRLSRACPVFPNVLIMGHWTLMKHHSFTHGETSAYTGLNGKGRNRGGTQADTTGLRETPRRLCLAGKMPGSFSPLYLV